MRYTVVIPVLNQLKYTQQCVDSLLATGTPAQAVLVIDNASTDETPNWLASRPEIPHLHNAVNLGCGGAWAQGSFQAEGDWVVLLNNDVLAGPNAIGAMLDSAEKLGLGVVSPALFEGSLDYDFQALAPQFTAAMNTELREGWFHGVCFAVRRSVFNQVGFPDTDRELGGHEDKEFLVRCLRHGIKVGTVGSAVFHHFGSITQKAIKEETKQKSLGDRHYAYRRMGMGWWARKRFKAAERQQQSAWSRSELARRGFTLHMLRENAGWKYL
jgi:N-acetylglucosaminyl-diphospho-decaprenol L-rhamnosyltransferase